jgi:hypothetical protein
MGLQTATNAKTGERVVLVDNQWQPITQSATNKEGVKAYLVNDKWLTDEGISAPTQESTAGEVPGQRRQPTLSERALGTPLARIALGAATPFVGAFQAGANVGDVIAEKIGFQPTVGKDVADWWNNLQAMKEKGMETPEQRLYGAVNPDILGTAATVGTGVAGLGKSAATTIGKKVLEGGKLGAVFGAATPGIDTAEKTATAGAAGAALGAAAPIVIPAAARAAGWLYDAAKGKLVQMKAGKILREIAGPELDAIRVATANAAPGKTAAQAVQEAGIIAPTLQAMGEKGKTLTPELATQAAQRKAAEKAARKATIVKVTPNQALLEAERANASNVAYGKAYSSDAQRLAQLAEETAAGRSMGGATGYASPESLTPALTALKQNPVIEAAAKVASKNRAGMSDPMASLEGLHLMKIAIDNRFKNRLAPTALQKFDDAALMAAKQQLLAAIEGTTNKPGISPLYGLARQQYAAMSPEIDQAKVLNEMLSVLNKPGGGERAGPFLNVLGRGESALLKKSTGFPRYEGLEDVLTQPQMRAANKVAGELERDMAMSELATEGNPSLTKLLNQDTSPFKLPAYLNWVATSLNSISNKLQGRVNDKTLVAIAKGMQTGKGASELLNAIPFKERNLVMKAMVDSKVWNPAVLSTVGSTTGNALAPKQQSQNALAPP